MGIINIVKTIKEVHNESIVLVKVGNFYYCYGKDSYIISYLLNYKVNLLKDNIYSCAFSQNAISKVMAKLENAKISYLILDRRNNYKVDEKYDFKNLNRYNKFFERAKNEISSKMRVEKIYQYLLKNLKDRELIGELEKVIYERGKIQSN